MTQGEKKSNMIKERVVELGRVKPLLSMNALNVYLLMTVIGRQRTKCSDSDWLLCVSL